MCAPVRFPQLPHSFHADAQLPVMLLLWHELLGIVRSRSLRGTVIPRQTPSRERSQKWRRGKRWLPTGVTKKMKRRVRKKRASLSRRIKRIYGAPGVTRTRDLLIRSQTLYPTELRAHSGFAAFLSCDVRKFREESPTAGSGAFFTKGSLVWGQGCAIIGLSHHPGIRIVPSLTSCSGNPAARVRIARRAKRPKD